MAENREPESKVYLSKSLGALDVFTISAGTMIGAGIFILPGILVSKAGPASILCFIVAGLLSGCAALSICELATAMPKSGGSYYFISRSMGAMLGSIIGWGSLLGLVFKGAFAFIGAGEYLEVLVDIGPIVTAVAACALLVSINVFGTGVAGKLQNLIVVMVIAIFGVYILQGLFMIEARYLHPFFSGGVISFIDATGMSFIGFLGLINVSAVSEEVRRPSRDLPLGILSSVAFVTALYVAVMMVTVGILPVWRLLGSLTPVAEAAEKMIGGTGTVFMVVCGMLATMSTGNAALLSSSRYPLAMARDNLMPGWLQGIDELFKSPARSIFLVGTAVVALIVFVDLENIVKLGSTFNIVVFALINASVILMRKADPSWYRPTFRSPLYPWVQLVGIVGCFALVPFMGLTSILATVFLVIIGVAWYIVYARKSAFPEYGLKDVLRSAKEQSLSRSSAKTFDIPASRSRRLVVPILPGKVSDMLLGLAAVMGREFEQSVGLFLFSNISERLADRGGALAEITPQYDIPLDTEIGTNLEVVRIYGHSMTSALESLVEERSPEMLLMELPENTSGLMREIGRVARRVPCDAAFLKPRTMSSNNKILVASSLPEENLKIVVAGALARQWGSRVFVLRVYPKETREISPGDLEGRILQSGVLHGVPLEAEIRFSDDPLGEIVRESSKHDLLITGSGPYERGTPLGAFVRELDEGTDCPILITRPAAKTRQSVSIRFLERFFRI